VLTRHEHRSAARFVLVVATLAFCDPARAQAPSRKADSVLGEVTAADVAGRHLVIKTDAGTSLKVRLADDAAFLRAKPGASTLADATPMSLEEIGAGDRVLARGTLSDDKASIAARQIVVMTKGDIAQKQEKDRAEWRRRGVLGVVTAVDAATGDIALRVGRMTGGRTVVVATADHPAVLRRYAPDSVKFTDARPSTVGEVQVGDQLRALGDRTPDGARLVAEQVVFGTFRTLVGNVTAVDAAGATITLRDVETRRAVVVSVGADARVRRLPPEMAARLLRFSEPAEDAGERQGRGAGGWSRGGGGPGGGPEDLIDRLAPATLAELKNGDLVLVSSAKGADPGRANAIALVSGLEALQPPARGGRGARGAADIGLPADLMDLGLGIP
jgi:hypothetical protein